MTHSILRLKEAGYQVFAVDRNPVAPGLALVDGFAPVDIVDADAVAEYAQTIGVDLILVINGGGVTSGAVASYRLGLPGLPPEVALRSQNKGRSRDCWKAAGICQPEYRVVRTHAEFEEAADAIGFPLVIKPTTKWGSRGVSMIHEASELSWAIDFAAHGAMSGEYIVEKAIAGIEVSVEGLVQHGRPQVLAIGDKEMQDHPRFRVGMVLNYPAGLPPFQIQAIEETVGRAVQALDIENGAFDAECMVNEAGVFILEINPRPGGGHIFGQIVEAVSGVCMPVAYAKILLGEDVDIRPRYQKGTCYKFFCPPPGVFRGVSGLEEARRMPGVLDLWFDMAPGAWVRPIEADADRPGLVVALGEDRATAIQNANQAIGRLKFDIEP
jgi:biotin carboxylase